MCIINLYNNSVHLYVAKLAYVNKVWQSSFSQESPRIRYNTDINNIIYAPLPIWLKLILLRFTSLRSITATASRIIIMLLYTTTYKKKSSDWCSKFSQCLKATQRWYHLSVLHTLYVITKYLFVTFQPGSRSLVPEMYVVNGISNTL